MRIGNLSRRLGRIGTAAAALAIGSVALVASAGAAAPSTSVAANAGTTAGAERSDVATAVQAAIAAGLNPSSAAKAAKQTAGKAENGTVANAGVSLSPSVTTNQVSTSSDRPGWGCGDKNHHHLGPPGRPVGTVSPCNKH
jgi:hypothetical protein